MENEKLSFIEELLADVELREEQNTEAYFDLMLLQISELEEQIAKNFAVADEERRIISDWALRKNSSLQSKIEFAERKLEAFIVERGDKTIEFANGILKYHKKPAKVEIADIDLFLKNAKPELLNFTETVKPDLNKIRAYIKSHQPPPGVNVIQGKEEFSYKINRKDKENVRNNEEETGDATEHAVLNRVAG